MKTTASPRHALAAAAVLLILPAISLKAQSTVYDSIPNGYLPTLPSEAYAATQTSEFGGEVTLTGLNRVVDDVTVGLATYAPESYFPTIGTSAGYNLPMTLNIYSVGSPDSTGAPTVGTLLATQTTVELVPWRPATTVNDGSEFGEWTDANGNNDHGYFFTAKFDLSSLDVTLPSSVIVTMALNTGSYGADPTGDNSAPYNALNFALGGGSANIGTNGEAFQAQNGGALLAVNYGAADVPTIEIQATAAPEPSTYALLGLGALALIGFARRKRALLS